MEKIIRATAATAGKNAIEVYDNDGKLLKAVRLEETDKNAAA